jgi:hypothetical protein
MITIHRRTRPSITPVALAAIATILLPAPARSDTVSSDSRGLNRVENGVWELGVGSRFAFASDSTGDASMVRISSDMNASVSYFVRDNVSVDASALLFYHSIGDDNSALLLGGALGGTAHLRLGHGAFVRPGLGIGVLVGNRELPVGGGAVMEAPQLGVVARLELPLAYFINRNLHLEGGPQLDLTAGSYTPEGADSVGFTTVDGGFSVGAGYAF